MYFFKKKRFLSVILVGFLCHLTGCFKSTSPSPHSINLEKAALYNVDLGLYYLNQQESQKAKMKFLKALEQAPERPEPHEAIAYFFEQTKDKKKANLHYLKAIGLSQNKGRSYNHYGAFLCREGKFEDSIAYFIKATQDMRYLNAAGAYENAGLCAKASGNNVDAKKYLIYALDNDPLKKSALIEYVNITNQQQMYQETVRVLQRYSQITYHDVSLLKVGISAADKAGLNADKSIFDQKIKLIQVKNLGEPHDDDSNTG